MTTTTRRRRTLDQRAEFGQPLTDRETAIIIMLADGQHDPEIAAGLEIAPRTYRRHVVAAQVKLGARSRAHLVALAIRGQVIP